MTTPAIRRAQAWWWVARHPLKSMAIRQWLITHAPIEATTEQGPIKVIKEGRA